MDKIIQDIIEQAHMAGHKECCDRSPSAYEATVYYTYTAKADAEAEIARIKRGAQLELLDKVGSNQYRHPRIKECVILTDTDIRQLREDLK